ncbi:MAG: hypothetical protein K2P77_09365 [Burkholderiaceae bacterium]|nr:hypothetical protein [Burkholderiaceae bacterium]
MAQKVDEGPYAQRQVAALGDQLRQYQSGTAALSDSTSSAQQDWLRKPPPQGILAAK